MKIIISSFAIHLQVDPQIIGIENFELGDTFEIVHVIFGHLSYFQQTDATFSRQEKKTW